MLKKLFPGMVGLVIFLVLWEIQRADYLLFHTLTELFGVIVAGSVSILVWNARAYIRRPAFFLLGTAFGFVATFDLLHALAFPGLALLPGAAENRTAQLWLAARLVEALTLLVFVAWWDREIDLRLAVGGLAGGSLILLASILAWNNFPIAYQASLGQTPFKIGTEILILCLLLVTLYLLTTRRAEMDQVLFTPLMLGLFFSFVSEVAITYYTHMVETATVLAHFLKVASFYMFYRAMIVSGIQQPFKVLFQDLARRENELDETNRRLSQVNNRLRSVLNALPVGVIVTDSGGQVIEKNPLSDGLWGQSVVSAGISGSRRPYQAWIPVTGETDRPEDVFIRRALAGNASNGELVDLKHRDGRLSTLVVSSAPVQDELNNLIGAIAVAQDITAQRTLEREARDIAREMRRWVVESDAVFNALTDAVVVYDQDGIVQRANPQTIALYGFDPLRLDRQVVARRLNIHNLEGDLFPIEMLPSGRAMRGEVLVNQRFNITNPRGRSYAIMASASPVYVGKEITGVVAVWRDVTERERLVREVEIQKDLLQAIFDADPGGLALVSKDGLVYRMANKAYRALTPHPEIDPVDQPVSNVFPIQEGFRVDQILREVIETGQPFSAQNMEGRYADGVLRHFSVNIQRSNWGNEPAALVIVWETTLLEQAHQAAQHAAGEARAYAAQLERSNRELESFAYVASHDLLEPLRKIKLFGERIKVRAGASFDATQADFLERMISAAHRMEGMITDLLTYSRVTSKAQPFSRVDLNQVAHEVTSDLEALIERTRGRVDIGALPKVDADPLQMRQLLQNLIGNALKFHRPGVAPEVCLRTAEPVELRDIPGAVAFSVVDNGIGFEMQYLERIFRPFERLHGRSEFEGSGMGLAICAKIVERHGGKIHAHSQVGEGTRFTIELPCQGG